MTWYFPLTYHRSRMWVLGPAPDNGFRVFSPLPLTTWALGFLSDERLPSSVFIKGPLCGKVSCWTARSQRANKACPCRAACYDNGPKVATLGTQWWPRRKDICRFLEDFPLTLLKKTKKSVFSRKILKTQRRPPRAARCSEGGRQPWKWGHTEAGQAEPL